MKNYLPILFMLLISFSACKKDKENDQPVQPKLEILTDSIVDYNYTGTSDSTIQFDVVVYAEAKIKYFFVQKTQDDSTYYYGNPTDFSGKTMYTYHFQYQLTPNQSFPIKFKFQVIDNNNNEINKTFSIYKLNLPQAPSISVSNNITSYCITAINDTTIAFNVNVTAEGKIDQFTIKKTVGSTTTSYGSPTGFSGETSYTYNFQETFNVNYTYPIKFNFIVVDKYNRKDSVIVNFHLPTALAYENTSGVIWNAISPYLAGWDLGTNVSVIGSSTSADLYNTTTSQTTNAWAKEWASRTGSKFVKASTSFDYTNATVESATAEYAAGTELTTVTPLTGEIYITKIKGGTNYAVIKVGTITETPAPANGGDNLDKIAFSYKKLAQGSTK